MAETMNGVKKARRKFLDRVSQSGTGRMCPIVAYQNQLLAVDRAIPLAR
jgi:hypothetical protein